MAELFLPRLSVCLFVCFLFGWLSARLHKHHWMDFHKTWWDGWNMGRFHGFLAHLGDWYLCVHVNVTEITGSQHLLLQKPGTHKCGWVVDYTCGWIYYVPWCEPNTNLYRRILILLLSDKLATGAGAAQLSQHSKPFSWYNCHCLHCKHRGGQWSDLLVYYLPRGQTIVDGGPV